jgi:hypothetical protein
MEGRAMLHARPFRRIAIALVVCAAIPAALRADTRHHITLGLGYTKLLSDALKDDTFDVGDLTNAFSGQVGYRLSINPSFDLCLESRGMIAFAGRDDGSAVTLTNTYFGPGLRWNASSRGPRAYLQGNVMYVKEEVDVEWGGIEAIRWDNSAGFGIFGGVDIPLTKLLSLPIEVHYLYAKPEDDVSGVGANVGITFNRGAM